jgi:histidinol dehydrogenase
MITIKGFNKAKPLLTRTIPLEYSTISMPKKGRVDKKELSTEQIVRQIINEVQSKGDKALFYYTRKLDKVELNSLEATRKEISAAYQKVDKKLLWALSLAASRIHEFHAACKKGLDTSFLSNGVGRQVKPLNRVGLYVPGGTAVYPSTVLMTAIPARTAGVHEIIMVTPPQKDGTIPAPTLVAADIAGVNRIFKLGGAQAIAALAYGTESVPKVDKICGPGNIFVAMAKKLVFGVVDIDGIQGPSEIIIVADDKADASFCAADLIAQSEHDPMASAILITTSAKLAASVESEIKAQLKKLKRQQIASKSLKSRGMIVLIDNLDEALELVNLYAPEHLLLMMRNAKRYIKKIDNAGCIFINETSPVVLGDYIAGPSHVLPTGGTARFSSPLGIGDFLKIINIVALQKDDLEALGKPAIDIAEAEGLDGHAQAIKIRLQAAKSKTK